MSGTFPRPFLLRAGNLCESNTVCIAESRRSCPRHRAKSRRLTPIDWVICGVACFGFAFDTYELLALTLTVQPALTEFLTAKPGSAEFNHWIGWMFYIPAIAGGIFGLLGGYLIDRFGRRRVLILEHSAVLFFHAGHGLFVLRAAIADLSLHHVRRRIGRIRRRDRLAGRIVPGKRSKRNDSRLLRRFLLPRAGS